jgi:hypothetical protein
MHTLHSRRTFLLQTPVSLGMLALALRNPHLMAESATTIPPSALLEPATIGAQLEKSSQLHWKILQVGFHSMFDQKHIRGAIYAGPASQPDGLALLRRVASAFPQSTPILLYCGCCPWTHCPNIAPAWDQLQSMHFTAVKVLRIENNFGADWVANGYPVA